MIFDKPISAAKHLQQIIHMEFEEQPLIDLFHKVYKRKKRTVEWFYQCARFSVDTLGRLWGTSLRDGGYDIKQNSQFGSKILKQLMDALDQMKPCTAIFNQLNIQCCQAKLSHTSHRVSMEDNVKNKSKYRKILKWFTVRGQTIVWNGEFQFIDDEKERDKELENSFWDTAECFAKNDTEKIQEAMRVILEHPDYRSCIWETLLLGSTQDYDQELILWAKRLAVDSMRLLEIQQPDNIWDKAVSDWEYLNVLCKKIPLDKITLKKQIGTGSFGNVYEGLYSIHNKDSIQCAIKVISSETKGFDLNILRREIAVMSLIEDKTLLKLYGYCFKKDKPNGSTIFYMVTELMDCNLQQWLNNRDSSRKFITVDDIISIASPVAEGIQTLHNYNIIHRDIKPANILIKNHLDNSIFVVLADMGLARLVSYDMSIGVGSFGYIAPEVCENGSNAYNHQADVYSFGKLLEYMIQFLDPNDVDIYESDGRALLNNLVSLCCSKIPSERTSMIHILYCLKEYSYIDPSLNETSESQKEEVFLISDLVSGKDELDDNLPKKTKRHKRILKKGSIRIKKKMRTSSGKKIREEKDKEIPLTRKSN